MSLADRPKGLIERPAGTKLVDLDTVPLASSAKQSDADAKMAIIDTLYVRAQKASGGGLFKDVDHFQKWLSSTYGQKNRFYHGPGHLLEMTNQPQMSDWTQEAYRQLAETLKAAHPAQPFTEAQLDDLKNINLVAALAHDTEYHVDGKLTDAGKEALAAYVLTDAKGNPTAIRNDIAADDKVAHMVLDLFDMKPGQKLLFFAGQNEFLSALSVAKHLEKTKRGDIANPDYKVIDLDFLTGVVASIEATWPFKKPGDFNALHTRLKKLYAQDAELSAKYTDPAARELRVDSLMGAATLLANQDVLSFLGGLRPDLDPACRPTVDTVRQTMRGGDELVPEEGSPELQAAPQPGVNTTLLNLLRPTFKRVRIYDLLLKPGDHNLFHSMKMGSLSYPPEETVKLMNEKVRSSDPQAPGNGDIGRIAYARRVLLPSAWPMPSPARLVLKIRTSHRCLKA